MTLSRIRSVLMIYLSSFSLIADGKLIRTWEVSELDDIY